MAVKGRSLASVIYATLSCFLLKLRLTLLRMVGHILKSPLKSTLGLFTSDGPSLRRKKAALLNGAVSISTPRSKPGRSNLYDATFSRSRDGHAGGDAAGDALDEFRGLMEDHDEHRDAEARLNGNEEDSAEEEDYEDWDVDTTFAKLLEQEYAPFSTASQRIYPPFTILTLLILPILPSRQTTETPDHHLTALTDIALPSAFANASSAYRKEIVDTLLPTLRSISETHVAFTKGGRDLRLSGGVVEFDDVCKEFEEGVGEREEIMEREFAEAKVNISSRP